MEVSKIKKIPFFTSVKWKVIVELATWHGGMWERLIRSKMCCLEKVIGRPILTCKEPYTLLVEFAGVIIW